MNEKTIRLTTAQALIRFLSNQYIELDGRKHKLIRGIFGIFGHGEVCGLGQALEQEHEYMKYYRIQNEQGGVHTAIGAAKHLNRLGTFAVTTSIGPGCTNLVTGAATATSNRIPVLLLPGDVFADRQPDPVLQQIEQHHNLNIQASDSLKPVCKYWDRIVRPEQLMTSAINAMRVLADPVNTGAVCLALCQDVQAEAYDWPEYWFKERIHRIDRRPISETSLEIAVKMLQDAKRPLIIAGGGIHYSFAIEELKKFVETTSIPISFTNAGKSAFKWDHPQNLGGMGVMGTSAANIIAKQADLIIAIGTRLMDFTTISKGAFLNPDVKILAINISNFDAYKMDAIQILADAKTGLIQIMDVLKNSEEWSLSKDYINEYADLKNLWDKEVDRLRSLQPSADQPKYLPQPAVLGVLNDFMAEKDVVVNAAGSTPGDMQRTWRSTGVKQYHVEYANSCMGYEIAAGLGIKYVAPDSDVYIIQGDGGYLMLHTELVTSLLEHKKIIILLFDSQGFNSINNLATGMGSVGFGKGSLGFGNELRERDEETDKLIGPFHLIDYKMNAISYGAAAYEVNSLEDLKNKLELAKQQDKTTLIHIKIEIFSQSGGYGGSWWRVGVSETSDMPTVKKARQEMEENMKKARKY
ncbi:MAG: 3D-(3,5/4)-trihydroxycyclohexane-1,2-dione acylhydrolase (decyclizing) [Candidatus Lokiarchaeota archaeon]|nr:3D-(3,5/4)-trihydroxycyclohexane-1,2-dione acylhydrolase (decyclizing) [Candidatus Lokiarchaeota archaeon]